MSAYHARCIQVNSSKNSDLENFPSIIVYMKSLRALLMEALPDPEIVNTIKGFDQNKANQQKQRKQLTPNSFRSARSRKTGATVKITSPNFVAYKDTEQYGNSVWLYGPKGTPKAQCVPNMKMTSAGTEDAIVMLEYLETHFGTTHASDYDFDAPQYK